MFSHICGVFLVYCWRMWPLTLISKCWDYRNCEMGVSFLCCDPEWPPKPTLPLGSWGHILFFTPTEEEKTKLFFCWDFQEIMLFHNYFGNRVIFHGINSAGKLPKQFFFEKNCWGQLWCWGSGPENYSPDLPPRFWKTFLVTKWVAMGHLELFHYGPP